MTTPQDIAQTDLETARLQVMDSFERFEASFRRNHPAIWWSSILGPIITTLAILTVIGATIGPEMVVKILIAAAVTFVFLSRFVILGGEFKDPRVDFLSTEELFLMVSYMDLIMAVVVTFHIGLMFKLPYLGEKIGLLVGDAQFIIKSSPWMSRAAFLGLLCFVILPVAATGCIGGAIFGRLLGLNRAQTLTGLALGSLAGNGLMYAAARLGATWIGPLLQDPWLKYGGLVVLIICIIALERFYQYKKRTVLDRLAARPDSTPAAAKEAPPQS